MDLGFWFYAILGGIVVYFLVMLFMPDVRFRCDSCNKNMKKGKIEATVGSVEEKWDSEEGYVKFVCVSVCVCCPHCGKWKCLDIETVRTRNIYSFRFKEDIRSKFGLPFFSEITIKYH